MDATETTAVSTVAPTRLAVCVALALCSLAVATIVLRAVWIDFYARLGVELPWATALVFRTSDALREGWGVLVGLAALALVLSPLRVVPHSAAMRTWLRLGLLQSALLALAMWDALELPLVTLQRCLCDRSWWNVGDDARSRAVVFGLGATSLACLGVGLAQTGAWLRLSTDALPLARGPLCTEAARAAVVAVLPALALGVLVHTVVSEWRLRPPAFLIVPPALAASGTIVLATFGVALAMRLRPERPHLGRVEE